MHELEAAIGAIDAARRDVKHSGVRTELESIAESLREMMDAEGGERTEPEGAFAESDNEGPTASADNLEELERHLEKLAENADRETVQSRLRTAHEEVVHYRTDRPE